MTQVFISYSRRDLVFVEQLAVDLKAASLDVWYDLSGLEGGARWRIEIEKAIRASQFVLVVLSPDSVASEWVEEEILFARNLKRNIIPLFYRQCDLPLGYHTRHYIDIRGANYKRNFGEILRALSVMKLDSEKKSDGLSQSRISRLIDIFRRRRFLRQEVKSTTSRYPAPTINPLPENIYGKIAYKKGEEYIVANSDGSNEFVVAKLNWIIQ